MTQVLKAMSKFIIGGFSLAVIGVMMVFSYGALNRIFNGNLAYVMFGLLVLDIACLSWGIIFVFQSRSVTQYAVAAMGFIFGLVGTLGLIGSEVLLAGMTPEQIAASTIPMWMRYGFIAVLAIHVVLVYLHHGSEPKIREEINMGVMTGQVVDRSQQKAMLQMGQMEDFLAAQLMAGVLTTAMQQLQASTGVKLAMPGLPSPQSQFAQAPVIDTMPCPACGLMNQVEQRFCGRCGSEMRPAPKPAPRPADGSPLTPLTYAHMRAKLKDELDRGIITKEAYDLMMAQIEMDEAKGKGEPAPAQPPLPQ